MPEISQSIAAEISIATAEVLAALPGQEMTERITVVRGYVQLAVAHPENPAHIEKLFLAVCILADLVADRGNSRLARRLRSIAGQIKRPSEGTARSRSA